MAASDIDNLLFYLETKAAEFAREAIRRGNTIAGHQADYAAREFAGWATWVEEQQELVAIEDIVNKVTEEQIARYRAMSELVDRVFNGPLDV